MIHDAFAQFDKLDLLLSEASTPKGGKKPLMKPLQWSSSLELACKIMFDTFSNLALDGTSTGVKNSSLTQNKVKQENTRIGMRL